MNPRLALAALIALALAGCAESTQRPADAGACFAADGDTSRDRWLLEEYQRRTRDLPPRDGGPCP